jgi:TatD DNase family protein
MWIDTHCHLDALEFGAGTAAGAAVARQAAASGVHMIVIPAVERANFDAVTELGQCLPNCCYALGIHPMYVPRADPADLEHLRARVHEAMTDPRFVGIGEIGLDLFIPSLKEGALRAKQDYFYQEQLKIAREFALPVLLHVRRSQDEILKQLRRISVPGGIAHAFNGSFQQAETFVKLGFKLGLGGAMTFTRALQIRRLASDMAQQALVLETDAPDISPSWLHPACNTPAQLPAIGAVLAELRHSAPEALALQTSHNAATALPRMAALL